jgi:RecA-family ATPase
MEELKNDDTKCSPFEKKKILTRTQLSPAERAEGLARIPAQIKQIDSSNSNRAAPCAIEIKQKVDISDKRQPLTIRTVGEIVEMKFDDAELILTNGYLAVGERTAVCGMGGVGKSRLVMQLALCCGTGRDFLGWETQGRKLRWIFLQTENSCRRLKYDLGRMLTAFTPEEQEAIKAGVFFHTLEADDDGFLMLDLENSERIIDAIARFKADIVVFDPLRDFGSDDLNSDKYMTETLREISRITKRGNPKRIPLIIHHAGTGKSGIQKATGFDRSSFGRNSKVLFPGFEHRSTLPLEVPTITTRS